MPEGTPGRWTNTRGDLVPFFWAKMRGAGVSSAPVPPTLFGLAGRTPRKRPSAATRETLSRIAPGYQLKRSQVEHGDADLVGGPRTPYSGPCSRCGRHCRWTCPTSSSARALSSSAWPCAPGANPGRHRTAPRPAAVATDPRRCHRQHPHLCAQRDTRAATHHLRLSGTRPWHGACPSRGSTTHPEVSP